MADTNYIKKMLLNNIKLTNKIVFDKLDIYGDRFNVIEVGNKDFIVKWSLYPSLKIVEQSLIINGWKGNGTGVFTHSQEGTISLDYTDVASPQEDTVVGKTVDILEKTPDRPKGDIQTIAKTLVFEHKGNIKAISDSLGYEERVFVDGNGFLTKLATDELTSRIITLTDNVNNDYKGGDADSKEIQKVLHAIDTVKAVDIFTKTEEGRSRTSAINKLLKETLTNNFQTKFEKGIGSFKYDNLESAVDNYPDAKLVGNNFNPQKNKDYHSLVNDLRNNVIVFDFLDSKGDHRHAIGTRNSNIIERYEFNMEDKTVLNLDNKETIDYELSKGYIKYFDMQREEFRTFRLYPNGKGGNKSRLLSCVTQGEGKQETFKRTSWNKINILDTNTWLYVWDKITSIPVESNLRDEQMEKEYLLKESIFSELASNDGNVKPVKGSDDLITKFINRTNDVKDEKKESEETKEEIRNQRDEASAEVNKRVFNELLPNIQATEKKQLQRIRGFKQLSDSLKNQQNDKSFVNIIRNSGLVKDIKQTEDLGTGFKFVADKNEYYVSPIVVANLSNGIIYGTLLNKDTFKKWETTKKKNLFGYDEEGDLDKLLHKLGERVRLNTKITIENGKFTEDDLRIQRIEKGIRNHEKTPFKVENDGSTLKIYTDGGAFVTINKKQAFIYKNNKDNPLMVWDRDVEVQGMTKQLRQSIKPFLEGNKKRNLQGLRLTESEYIEVIVILNLIYTFVFGKVEMPNTTTKKRK